MKTRIAYLNLEALYWLLVSGQRTLRVTLDLIDSENSEKYLDDYDFWISVVNDAMSEFCDLSSNDTLEFTVEEEKHIDLYGRLVEVLRRVEILEDKERNRHATEVEERFRQH